MVGTPLVIGEQEREVLAALRQSAADDPVDVRQVVEAIKSEEGLTAHRDRMNRLTVPLPVAYFVTLSIEHGHPAGTMRHMSMSVKKEGRVPNPEAIWMVAEELGFVGSLETCEAVWPEELSDGGVAINVVQSLRVVETVSEPQ